MHAFSGSAEMAREYVKLGAMISLAGPVTFKNARVPKEVAAEVPLDHLLVETDSPYLTPHPLRGKRNDPRLLHLIIEEIAQIKGLSPETVEQATTDNAKRIFQL
jgi:TatD DNase family protein